MKLPNIIQTTLGLLLSVGLVALPASPARALDSATYTSDLDSLIYEGNQLLGSMKATVLTPLTMSSQTAVLASSTADYLSEVVAVYDTTLDTSSTITLTNTMLASLETLSATAAGLARESMRLTAEMVTLAALTGTSSLDASLAAMLQLSTDIGAMADRIGEMADRILIMADNIGIMADRILMTQVIQNSNIDLVVNAMLVTQQNLLKLASDYDL